MCVCVCVGGGGGGGGGSLKTCVVDTRQGAFSVNACTNYVLWQIEGNYPRLMTKYSLPL